MYELLEYCHILTIMTIILIFPINLINPTITIVTIITITTIITTITIITTATVTIKPSPEPNSPARCTRGSGSTPRRMSSAAPEVVARVASYCCLSKCFGLGSVNPKP